MNKKVIKIMIALVMVFLVALYVLKIFFPEQFMMAIQNERIVAFGNMVDNSWWLHEICAIITSFVTYWLYLCACTRKWSLNWKEIVAVLLVIAITHGLYEWDVNIASGFSIISMFMLPAIFKADLTPTAVTFSFHYTAQLLSTKIRSLPMLLTNVNYATILLMTFECYFWLLLFYLYFNYNKKGVIK